MAKDKHTNKPHREPAKNPPEEKQTLRTTDSKTKVFADKWYVILLVTIALVVNAHTITFDYTYDDATFTSRNSLIDIRGAAAIPELFTHAKNYSFQKRNYGSYRPLLPITFAIERSLFDFNPMVSHLINLLLFALLIAVLFKLLRRIFAERSVYIPFFILLLFELHPVHTEVVASVKSRDEIMALLFTAMSVMQSFKYIDDGKIRRLILSGVYFLLALLSKESPVCFVAIVPLTLYFFTNAKPMKLFIADVPYLASTIVFVSLRYGFLDKAAHKTSIMENVLVGASGLSEKLGTILFIQLKYIVLLIFPYFLTSDYSYNEIPLIPVTNYKAIVSAALIMGLLVYAFINLKRKNIFSYCILFYFLSMGVTSNLLIEIGATMGERFLFIPSLGFCIAVVFLLALLLKANTTTVSYNSAPKFSYVILVISLLYCVRTVARNEDWKNNLTLFKSAVESSPDSWRTQSCMGVTYKEMAVRETNPELVRKYINESIAYYNRSLAIYPDWTLTQADLGAAYYVANNYDSAVVHLNRAIALDTEYESPYVNLGGVYLARQKYMDALVNYRKALSINSENIITVFNIGVCYVAVQKYDSAIYNFEKVSLLDPDYNNHKAIEYTSIVYKMAGNMDSAIKYKTIANRYNPSFAP